MGNEASTPSSSPIAPDPSDGEKLPRIEKVDRVAQTKWLAMDTLTFLDQKGQERKWDVATRTTKQAMDKADAVFIIPLLRKADGTLDTILVEQYRPPVRRTTLEFPAGLIDAGEEPEQAALRELTEETGYVGMKATKISRQLCMSPGLTDESVHVVMVEVDVDSPENKTLTKHPDPGEIIETKRVPLKDALTQLTKDDGKSGMPLMGLYMFALGMEVGESELKKEQAAAAKKKAAAAAPTTKTTGTKSRTKTAPSRTPSRRGQRK